MQCSMMWPPFEITGALIEKHVNAVSIARCERRFIKYTK
jgi:hypothetical protein